MIKTVRQIGFKLAGEDPQVPPDTPSGTSVVRTDFRRQKAKGRKDGELETSAFGDGIII